jgi:hypothetical protein
MRKVFLLTFFTTITIVASAQVDLKKGLMLYLPFSGNTLDASPNHNDATNYGATLTKDQWGNANSAYYFNGISSYMQILNNVTLQPNSQITLCARVNVKGFYDGTCHGNAIVDKGTDNSNGSYILRFSNSNAPGHGDCYFQDTTHQNYYGGFYNQGPALSIIDNAPYIVENQWDCLIYTYDGTIQKMYVNGVLRHQQTSSSLIGANSDDVFLGYHAGNIGYPFWFHGIMDEVRVYNRALNIAEIDSVCSSTQPTGIVEVAPVENLPILSNPVGKELQLSLSAAQMGGQLSIIDMTGKVLISIPSLSKTNIALDGIAPGIYMVSYQLDELFMRSKMLKK